MSDVQWFGPSGVSVLMLPRGVTCDLPAGHRAALTHRNLWFSTDRGVGRLAMTGRSRLQPIDGGALATHDGGRQVWLRHGEVRLHDEPGARVGTDVALTRAPGGPWTSDALRLSSGAQWSAHTRPFPCGVGLVWCAEGFLYRHSDGLTTAVCPQTAFSLGPRGAMLLGDPYQAFALPGQPVQKLPQPILGPLTWSASGTSVLGRDLQRRPVCVDLAQGDVTAHVGPPALREFTFGHGSQLFTYGLDGLGHRVDVRGQMTPAPRFEGELVEARRAGVVDSEDQCWQFAADGWARVPSLASSPRTRVCGLRLIGTHAMHHYTLGWSATGLLLRWSASYDSLSGIS